MVEDSKRELAEQIVHDFLREICDGTFGDVREWSLTEWHNHESDCPDRGEGTSRVCCKYDKLLGVVRGHLDGWKLE